VILGDLQIVMGDGICDAEKLYLALTESDCYRSEREFGGHSPNRFQAGIVVDF
jgi:hypothetical protein